MVKTSKRKGILQLIGHLQLLIIRFVFELRHRSFKYTIICNTRFDCIALIVTFQLSGTKVQLMFSQLTLHMYDTRENNPICYFDHCNEILPEHTAQPSAPSPLPLLTRFLFAVCLIVCTPARQRRSR